tara:strand:+ start:814 stop:1026 length:213 start_codon:yes stop_codon:yes gene_type:complete
MNIYFKLAILVKHAALEKLSAEVAQLSPKVFLVTFGQLYVDGGDPVVDFSIGHGLVSLVVGGVPVALAII